MVQLDWVAAGAPIVGILLVVLALFVGMASSVSGEGRMHFVGGLAVFMIALLLLLLRDFTAASDYNIYAVMYECAETLGRALATDHGDFMFSLTMWLGQVLGLSFDGYLIFFSLLVLTLVGGGFALMAPRYAPMAFALFLATSTFVFLNVNVLRQGLAMGLMVLALGLWIARYRLWALPVFLAIPFAHSRTGWLVIMALGGAGGLNRLHHFSLPVFAGLMLFASLLVAFILLPLNIALDGPGAGRMIHHAGRSGVTSELVLYMRIVVLWLVVALMIGVRHWHEGVLPPQLLHAYIALCALTTAVLPITLASGRLVYMASALIPVLLASLIGMRLPLPVRRLVASGLLLGGFTYAVFNYSYPSVVRQLGFGWLLG